MWERTISIGSAGKMFSSTGWRTGWANGPANLMHNLQIAHKTSTFVCCNPIQEALARIIEFETTRRGTPDCYLQALASKELVPKKDFIVKALKESGFNPIVPEAGYFILADWSPLASKLDLSTENDKYKDYRFTKKLTKEAGVLGIPPSAFYSDKNKHHGENYVRFCYIKKDENLKVTRDLLKKWSDKLLVCKE